MSDYLSPYTLQYPEKVPAGYRVGAIASPENEPTSVIYIAYVPENVIVVSAKIGDLRRPMTVNITNDTKTCYPKDSSTNSLGISNYVINNNRDYSPVTVEGGSYTSPWTGTGNGSKGLIGMAVYVPDIYKTIDSVIQYLIENNPWKGAAVTTQIPVRWKGLEDTFEITVNPQS